MEQQKYGKNDKDRETCVEYTGWCGMELHSFTGAPQVQKTGKVLRRFL